MLRKAFKQLLIIAVVLLIAGCSKIMTSNDDMIDNYLENIELPNIKSKTFLGWLKELEPNKIRKNQEFNYKNIKMKVLSLEGGNPTKIELTFTTNYEIDNEII